MSMSENVKPVEILLVEDNPGDARLTIEMFKEGRLMNNIHHVMDGLEALSFLRREGAFRDAPKPDIILLDLNLPRMHGKQVLSAIKQTPNWRRIPVIVLSTSASEEDVMQSYDLHANAYITKPVDLDNFMAIIKVLEGFWIDIVRLPDQ